ncbi:hypothetical protein C6A88_02340, partial [Mycolicibacterium austroafricanum]
SSTLFSGSSMARQIEPRHRSCQLLWLSSQWLACQSLSATDIAVLEPAAYPARIPEAQHAMSAPASMISCLNARSGSLQANSPSGGNVSTRMAYECA